MREIKWHDFVLVPTKSALEELYRLNLTLEDVKEVLERGHDCGKSKRCRGTYEKCLDTGRKTTKVVVVKDYNMFHSDQVWVIIHVGTYPKR